MMEHACNSSAWEVESRKIESIFSYIVSLGYMTPCLKKQNSNNNRTKGECRRR